MVTKEAIKTHVEKHKAEYVGALAIFAISAIIGLVIRYFRTRSIKE